MNRRINHIIAYLLVITMIISMLTGCSSDGNALDNKDLIATQNPTSVQLPTVTPQTTVPVTPEVKKEPDIFAKEPSVTPHMLNTDEPLTTIEPERTVQTELGDALSLKLEDYIGDVETFVYGLLANELSYNFDVFPAFVTLSDGVTIFGLGYTDYGELFQDEETLKYYYPAGFISAFGELTIPSEEIESGLIVQNIDYNDDEVDFTLSYESEELNRHCIVYGQYIEYGIKNGQIYYMNVPCDDIRSKNIDFNNLGSLYSYDTGEARLVYEAGDGKFVLPEGVALEIIDYEELEREVFEIINLQNANEVEYSIESYITISQDAVSNYILSMQQETFMGFDVNILLEEIKKIDANECFRFTSEGIEIATVYDDPFSLSRFLVASASVVVFAIGLIGTALTVEVPVLSAVAGALTAFAVNTFIQTVVEKKPVTELDWKSIVIGTVAGAVSGFVGPYIMANLSGVAEFFVDSAVDGIIGGVEQVVEKFLNGENGKGIIETFGYGFAIGFAFSAGIKGAAKAIGKVVSSAGKGIYSKFPKSFQNTLKELKNTLSDKVVNSKFVKKLKEIKDALENTSLHSKYIAKKSVEKQLKKLINEESEKYFDDSLNSLAKKPIFDKEGNLLVGDLDKVKDYLRNLAKNSDDGSILAYFMVDDELVSIKKQNGVISVVFDESKYHSVKLDNYIKNVGDKTRTQVHLDAIDKFKMEWADDINTLPKSLADRFDDMGVDWKTASNDDILNVIRKSDMVLHEDVDLRTVTLVSRAVHDKALPDGIAHLGGISLSKKVKADMAIRHFDRIVSMVSTVGAINAN